MALEPVAVSLEEQPNHELVDMTRRFWWSLVLTVPILLGPLPSLRTAGVGRRWRWLLPVVLVGRLGRFSSGARSRSRHAT
jgi:hypothetical protein